MTVSNDIKYLDERLLAVAKFVRDDSMCADIGCDHGKLSVYLAKSGKCKKVFACDISEKPLEKARKLIKNANCTNVETRLGNGLNAIKENEVNDIVIAGLSGVTIAEILAEAQQFWKDGYRFVFVPVSKSDYLRKFLCENGFKLLCEEPVIAQGRVYPVMHVAFTGEKYIPTQLFCAVGLVSGKSAGATAYKQKLLRHLKKQKNEQLTKEVEQWFT